MSYWASFARSGDPGRGARDELPAWSAWDGRPQGHKYLILDTEAGGGLRMGSEPVTVESVLASVDADPRLTSQRDRCLVYRELARWGGGFGREEYPTAGREGCAEYPFDDLPLGLSGPQRPATAATQRQAAAGVGESTNRRRRSRLSWRPRARGASSWRMRRARSRAPMLASTPASW